ncbi:hypothetical protein T484DRAFT_1881174 [Baffinella frigidus]|nr:hypothetical protein T484DRAFT_1881174 [Cryptophyta sp. CCMP2293]
MSRNNAELTVNRSCARQSGPFSMAGEIRTALMGAKWGVLLCALLWTVEGADDKCEMTDLTNSISWPSQQCTLPCPGYENQRCTISQIRSVNVGSRFYCCICDDSGDRSAFKLCPTTSHPAPPDQTQVQYAGIASGLGDLGQVARTRFDVEKDVTVYARVAANEKWGKFHYLELSVRSWLREAPATLPALSNASSDASANATGSRRLLASQGDAGDGAAGGGEYALVHRASPDAPGHSLHRDGPEGEAAVAGGGGGGGVSFAMRELISGGLVELRDHVLWGKSGEDGVALGGGAEEGRRAFSSSLNGAPPRWYVRAKSAPDLARNPPFADFAAAGNNSVDIMNPWAAPYDLAFRGDAATVEITAVARSNPEAVLSTLN